MTCSHIQFLLPQYVEVIVWPFAVVSPPDVQNCNQFRDLHCESLFQRANVEATTQKECNRQQEQNGFLRMNGVALYEQHDAPSSSYLAEPQQTALFNSATTK